jgi:pyruvate/2-oxoglutarate dehydrogenase complex dihydrolipoamide acyltransferase (E2) component
VAVEIRLPPLGQTSDEMIVVEWYRQPGDAVREGEPLLSVETDKVTVDVEAAAAGTLLDVLVQPGDLVEAGTVIARIGAADEAAAEPPAPPP